MFAINDRTANTYCSERQETSNTGNTGLYIPYSLDDELKEKSPYNKRNYLNVLSFRERKQLDKLIKTRTNSDIHNQLWSQSNASLQYKGIRKHTTEIANSALRRRKDRRAYEHIKKRNRPLNAAPHRIKLPYPSVIARQGRRYSSINIDINAKPIHSEPCTCTTREENIYFVNVPCRLPEMDKQKLFKSVKCQAGTFINENDKNVYPPDLISSKSYHRDGVSSPITNNDMRILNQNKDCCPCKPNYKICNNGSWKTSTPPKPLSLSGRCKKKPFTNSMIVSSFKKCICLKKNVRKKSNKNVTFRCTRKEKNIIEPYDRYQNIKGRIFEPCKYKDFPNEMLTIHPYKPRKFQKSINKSAINLSDELLNRTGNKFTPNKQNNFHKRINKQGDKKLIDKQTLQNLKNSNKHWTKSKSQIKNDVSKKRALKSRNVDNVSFSKQKKKSYFSKFGNSLQDNIVKHKAGKARRQREIKSIDKQTFKNLKDSNKHWTKQPKMYDPVSEKQALKSLLRNLSNLKFSNMTNKGRFSKLNNSEQNIDATEKHTDRTVKQQREINALKLSKSDRQYTQKVASSPKSSNLRNTKLPSTKKGLIKYDVHHKHDKFSPFESGDTPSNFLFNYTNDKSSSHRKRHDMTKVAQPLPLRNRGVGGKIYNNKDEILNTEKITSNRGTQHSVHASEHNEINICKCPDTKSDLSDRTHLFHKKQLKGINKASFIKSNHVNRQCSTKPNKYRDKGFTVKCLCFDKKCSVDNNTYKNAKEYCKPTKNKSSECICIYDMCKTGENKGGPKYIKTKHRVVSGGDGGDTTNKKETRKSSKYSMMPNKHCVCGSPIYTRAYSKKSFPTNLCECDKANKETKRRQKVHKEKLANRKRQESICDAKAKKRNTDKKTSQRRKVISNKRDKKVDERQLREYKKHTDVALMGESVLDVAKLGIRAGASVVKCTTRAIGDPECTYYSLRRKLRQPKRTLHEIKRGISKSELFPTAKRIKNRIRATKLFRDIKFKLNNNPTTFYLLHLLDGNKSVSFKKRRPRRERVQRDQQCSLYISTLRKKRCLYVYNTCPWFYPQCISLLHYWKEFVDILLFILAIVVWSPCIVAVELCRAMLCCFLCND